MNKHKKLNNIKVSNYIIYHKPKRLPNYDSLETMDDLSRELIYYFINDNELLELINSVSSYTMNDESIVKAKDELLRLCESPKSITFWDTTKITNMEYMFCNKPNFNELLLWNTKNVTNMRCMFCSASSFNQPLEFNTKNVTTMCCIFDTSGMKILPLWHEECNHC